jgi:hypothetical protein
VPEQVKVSIGFFSVPASSMLSFPRYLAEEEMRQSQEAAEGG